MTHLGNVINRLFLEHGISAKKIADQAGIQTSDMSRLRSGKRRYISQENLAALAMALGRNTKERAELIAAHMKDESCGYYPDFIQVSTGKAKTMRSEIDPDIEYLQQHLSDSRLRQAVKSLVAIHRDKSRK